MYTSNLAKICLHKSTSAKVYPFTETDNDSLQKVREDMVGGPSIVFTSKAVVDETFVRNSKKLNLLLAWNASQLYPYFCVSRCQQDYTRDGNMTQNFINLNVDKINPESLRTWFCYIFKKKDLIKIESFYTTGTQKKIDCFKGDGFCAHCNTVFEAMGCFYHYCPCQEIRPSLTEEDIESGNQRREMNQMRNQYIRQKGYNVAEMCECEWWNLYWTTTCVKERLRESFPLKRPLREERLLEQSRSGKLFGYVQCDISMPEELKKNFDKFPPISKIQT